MKQSKPIQITGALPVKDFGCERIVIGTLVGNSKAIESVRDILSAECFTDYVLAAIYEAVRGIDAAGDDVNLLTVNAAMQKSAPWVSMEQLIEAQSDMTVGDLTAYALRLKELALRRRMWKIGQELVSAGTAETDEIETAQQRAYDGIVGLFGSAQAQGVTLAEAYGRVSAQMRENRRVGRGLRGTLTGFDEIDRRGGLLPSDLIIVAGESSHGKTSLASSFMVSAMKEGEDIALYSMEMTAEQMAARMAAMCSGESAINITQGCLPEERIEAVDRHMGALDMKRLHFDDRSTSSIDNILSSIRTMKIKYGIKGAVIDYLQILNVNQGRDHNKEQSMGEAARRLKNTAKALDIWIVALSQLSRDRDRVEPDMNRLRDSGQIAEAADVVMLVWRPELRGASVRYPEPYASVCTQGTAMINVAKGRNIGTFRFICGFDGCRTLFYPLSELPRTGGNGGKRQSPSFENDYPEIQF